jgi:hypothetical protein
MQVINTKYNQNYMYVDFIGQGGFGVPVADILSAPYTPACALSAHPCAAF